MTARIREGATYQDLIDLPENMVGEIIEGELYAAPRPAPRHSFASSVLGGTLTEPFMFGNGGPGGWVILDEPEIRLGANILVPDLGGWRRERFPEASDAATIPVTPDWVCEVLSPSNSRHDRQKKLPIYARHEVGYAWLIDPREQTLEVKKLINGLWTEIGYFVGDDVVRAEPFDAIEFNLARLWISPPPAV